MTETASLLEYITTAILFFGLMVGAGCGFLGFSIGVWYALIWKKKKCNGLCERLR